ncbi:MAG: hypothetical protein WDM78_02360 [Puia sp.]
MTVTFSTPSVPMWPTWTAPRIKAYTGNYTFWYESSQLMARQMSDKNKKTEDKRAALLEFIRPFLRECLQIQTGYFP